MVYSFKNTLNWYKKVYAVEVPSYISKTLPYLSKLETVAVEPTNYCKRKQVD